MTTVQPYAQDGVLQFGRVVLKALRIANIICAPLFFGMLCWAVLAPGSIIDALTEQHGAAVTSSLIILVRILMLLGLVMAIPVHIVLSRLLDMIDSIASKSVFTQANVARLRTIAWALLATQVIDLAYGAASLTLSHQASSAFDWQPSITAWLCVLMLFILARVFDYGVQLQDDLEGTV